MNPEWPGKPARNDSIRDGNLIATALEWIYFDLTRPENKDVWASLNEIEPKRYRIELFDSVWWMYFDDERRRRQGK